MCLFFCCQIWGWNRVFADGSRRVWRGNRSVRHQPFILPFGAIWNWHPGMKNMWHYPWGICTLWRNYAKLNIAAQSKCCCCLFQKPALSIFSTSNPCASCRAATRPVTAAMEFGRSKQLERIQKQALQKNLNGIKQNDVCLHIKLNLVYGFVQNHFLYLLNLFCSGPPGWHQSGSPGDVMDLLSHLNWPLKCVPQYCHSGVLFLWDCRRLL